MPEGVVTSIDLLAAVDELPTWASGAYVIDGDDGYIGGAVFAEGNRVCWAAVTGRGRRLRDLMQLPLAEALRRHTVESLIRLDGTRGRMRWIGHRGDGYRPRATFTAATLLASVGAQLYAAEAIGADALDALVVPGAIGASFVPGEDGGAVLVRERNADRVRLAALRELGEWALAALDVTAGFSRPAMERAVAAVRGRASLAWRGGRHVVHAILIDDRSALTDTVAELDRRGTLAVLSHP